MGLRTRDSDGSSGHASHRTYSANSTQQDHARYTGNSGIVGIREGGTVRELGLRQMYVIKDRKSEFFILESGDDKYVVIVTKGGP